MEQKFIVDIKNTLWEIRGEAEICNASVSSGLSYTANDQTWTLCYHQVDRKKDDPINLDVKPGLVYGNLDMKGDDDKFCIFLSPRGWMESETRQVKFLATVAHTDLEAYVASTKISPDKHLLTTEDMLDALTKTMLPSTLFFSKTALSYMVSKLFLIQWFDYGKFERRIQKICDNVAQQGFGKISSVAIVTKVDTIADAFAQKRAADESPMTSEQMKDAPHEPEPPLSIEDGAVALPSLSVREDGAVALLPLSLL